MGLPLTAIPTSLPAGKPAELLLLLNFEEQPPVDTSGNSQPLAYTGNPSVSLVTKKWGTRSMYFPGFAHIRTSLPKAIAVNMNFYVRTWMYLDPSEFGTWGRTIFTLGERSNNRSLWMRQRRTEQFLELYGNNASLLANMPTPAIDTFDNKWTYMLVQRQSGVVSVYIALAGESQATLWATVPYSNAIDSAVCLGYSTRMDESLMGYLDGFEVVVGDIVSDPTIIPTGPTGSG